jgi:hypothetical protein
MSQMNADGKKSLSLIELSAFICGKKDFVMPSLAPLIDTSVTLGQWPMRRVPCDDLDKLVEKLRAQNVIEAWAGHYDGLFHTNLTEVNNRLALACTSGVPLASPAPSSSFPEPLPSDKAQPKLVPFGEINPTVPNWETELDRCANIHHMPGVRLHPNYHNYKLDHPSFAAFLKAAVARKLIVQLTILMEDARMMHPLMQVAPVDITPLEKLVSQTPGLRLVLLNALTSASRTDKLYRLTNAGEVYVEIAMRETLAGLEALVKEIPVERILFGSHTPSFYLEAAALKLQESNLPITHLAAISHQNARRMLATS